jgi:hypothetical protein
MTEDFRLLMIGAMYENGGNTTHRFLDGHDQLFVYPFESQPGTRLVTDMLSSTFPVKYRWPVFALDATPEDDYLAILDEECKVRLRTPHVSKFRHLPLDLSDDERRDIYVRLVTSSGRSRPANVAAFFRATFDAWHDYRASGREVVHVGYSPIITVDAEQILDDLPSSHFLHIVRNPWSAYADTKKRPVPLSLDSYMLGWTVTQQFALAVTSRYPDRMHVLRLEDVLRDPEQTLGDLCEAIGVERSSTLRVPSWNGQPLDEVYPWGTIRRATTDANQATARELTRTDVARIREAAGAYLQAYDYSSFLAE